MDLPVSKQVIKTAYGELSSERLINIAIDFIKVNQPLPVDIKDKLSELGLLSIIDIRGEYDEE